MPCQISELAQTLIKQRSLSPDDSDCLTIITQYLQSLGFQIEEMTFADTKNIWAYHQGKQTGSTLLFAGHTDVVSAGDEQQWLYPPFSATLDNGIIYGRGAADMKGSLAAMMIATKQFINQHPEHNGRLAFLITGDEEAKATNGTVKVVECLQERHEQIDFCIVGEPSSVQQLGDVIKNGRRGSVTADLTIHGSQGHVAYPHLADNPIHKSAAFMQELVNIKWDNGNEHFPPTSMQIANIHAGTGNNNVIPGSLFIQFNFRFSNEVTVEELQLRVNALLKKHQLRYTISWHISGQPFLTKNGKLVDVVTQAVQQHCGITPRLSTDGGTSDGRFIAKLGTQIVELGPLNATIHKVNEQIKVADLQLLSQIYQQIMEQLLC